MIVICNCFEVFCYFGGWEFFFFMFDSFYYGLLFGEVFLCVIMGEVGVIVSDFWNNVMWCYGDVVWVIGEIILMVFLGMFGVVVVVLLLLFLVVKNFMFLFIICFVMCCFFDFVCGVDGLVWMIILMCVFGFGFLIGVLVILIMDIGFFGKMFFEVFENVDKK